MESEIHKVLTRELDSVRIGPTSMSAACCILPGSFNPLHQAHREMARLASQQCGRPVEFELSISNVDKPILRGEQIFERIRQFDNDCVWVTRARTFAMKAQLFPQCTFVIGADTALRLFDQKYYSSEEDLNAAITTLFERECRFLVFGRVVGNRFVDPTSELPIPQQMSSLFDLVPEVSFRMDISSTEIRRKSNSS